MLGCHFSFNLSSFTSQYAGAPLYIQASNGTTTAVLACEANNCTMPGSLRIGLTTPVNNDRYSAPATVFMRAQLTNGSGTYDEVAFNINGEWINGARDSADGVYYASKAGLAASATPYIVYAKVRQGNSTLYSVESQIVVDASVGVTLALTKPTDASTAPANTPLELSATPGGNVAAVQSVKFYANGALVATGVNNAGVWTANWVSPQTGNYVMMARAFDGSGVGVAQSATASLGITASTGGSAATPVPVTIQPPHLGNADAGTLPGTLGVSASGTATYSIPVVVPPGTAGLQPSLARRVSTLGYLLDCCYLEFFCVPLATHTFSLCSTLWLRSVYDSRGDSSR
ncbi:MAG: Ig-like domain-containing protein [Telluria sp.]